MPTCRGSFAIDLISALPLLFLPFVTGGASYLLVVIVLRLQRIQRVRFVLNMLFYILMMSVRGANVWRMTVGATVSVVYTIVVLTNFLGCLWLFLGKRQSPGEGWLGQTYSARPSCLVACLIDLHLRLRAAARARLPPRAQGRLGQAYRVRPRSCTLWKLAHACRKCLLPAWLAGLQLPCASARFAHY